MDEVEACLRELGEKKQEIVEFLRRLVKTPSPSGHEEAVAEIIYQEMKKLGYLVERDEMGNVVGRRGEKGGRSILFDAHMDNVGPGDPENWARPPFSAEIVDGIMYGRGTVDMKGALAAMIHGCAAPELKGELVLTCVVHEETNEGVSTRKIIDEEGLRPTACVLGEPTDMALSIGQRGRAVFRVTTRGATSHASMPELGENALYKMTPIVDAIRGANEELLSHPFLGKGTMTVTEIRCTPGGGPIVPDLCDIIVDRRTIPGETLEGITEEIKRIAQGAEVELVADEFTTYTGYKANANQFFASWMTERDHWLVKESLGALKVALRDEPNVIGWRFSTNGVATAGDLGIPTVGFGPGDPALAHQPNEHITLADVMNAAKGFSALALRLTA